MTCVKNCTYGLVGADLTPGEIVAILDKMDVNSPNELRISINNAANDTCIMPAICDIKLQHEKTKELIVYAIGSDGTIGAIRNAMKIL